MINNIYKSMFFNPFPGLKIDNNVNNVNKKNNIPCVLHFVADYSGCSFYRLKMQEIIMNYHNKANISSLNRMITDERFFNGIDVIRIQRQVTPDQLKYFKWLKSIQPKYKFRIIYEIDDIPIIEDIPTYNIARKEYDNIENQNAIKEMMLLCDEMTVTCDFMKSYFTNKVGVKNITVIPNFPAKFWMGNFYNQTKINNDYDKNKNKPRILYCGSNAHYNIGNNGIDDDLSHVKNSIINTLNKFQWVFLGGFPPYLKPYIDNKQIEFHPWSPLMNYPSTIYNLNIQAMIAPLIDNNFNRAKSDLKILEADCFGLPIFCQDMVTYKNADFKFTTGEEMIKLIENEILRPGHYKNLGYKINKRAQLHWLENEENIGCYEELYRYPYGSPERKFLSKYN